MRVFDLMPTQFSSILRSFTIENISPIDIVGANSGKFSKNLPLDVDYSTLNGYILKRTGGGVPPIDTMIFDEDFTFRIHSIDPNGVMTIELIDGGN